MYSGYFSAYITLREKSISHTSKLNRIARKIGERAETHARNENNGEAKFLLEVMEDLLNATKELSDAL